jgi:hypothetical protein
VFFCFHNNVSEWIYERVSNSADKDHIFKKNERIQCYKKKDTKRTAHTNLDKDIVLGFGFTINVQLLDSQRQAPDDIDQWPAQNVQAWIQQSLKLTQVFHDAYYS